MGQLVNMDTDKQIVSARELHDRLKICKRFSAWFETNAAGFIEGVDYTSVLSSTVVNNGAKREIQDYQLSMDMAKHICLMSRTQEGKQLRQALIDLEKQWNKPEIVMARAIRMAAGQIDVLKAEKAELQAKIEADKPKTIFADAVTASDSAVLVRDLAKMIRQNGYEIGEKRLYNWMRENGYICKGTTMPTQKAMELGLFEIEIRTIERGVGLPLERKTTKVTGKGQIYFANKFLA